MAKLKTDFTGHRIGRLYVIGRSEAKASSPVWRCLCDCGTEKLVLSGNLKVGNTISCGCARTDRIRSYRVQNTKHGMIHTPEYKSWSAMRDRCLTPTNKDYPKYGGRGITICSRWDSFESFFEDMGKRPSGTSLDRIDNNGNYEPENCRWADASTQSSNQRRFKDPEAMAEWSKLLSAAQRRRLDRQRQENGRV